MKIKLIQGDITKLEIDCIVNAANSSLLGGGGVDGAIHRAGGSEILSECRKIGGCETGKAVITNSGNLPCKKVIHTVGPIWRGGNNNERELLRSCYKSSFELALINGYSSIAFPNISTGIYGFPKELAAEIATTEIKRQLLKHPDISVIFICFDFENYEIYKEMLSE